MSENRRFVIHIGLPKTATTTLQRNVFPKAKDFRYMGKDDGLDDFKLIMPAFNFLGNLAFGSENDLNRSYETFQGYLEKEEIKRYANIDKSIPLLLSMETITSILIKPINPAIGVWAADPYLIFTRLKAFSVAMGYDIELVLTERNEKELFHSLYAQYLYRFNDLEKLNSLNKFLENGVKLDYMHIGFEWLIKGNLKKIIESIFSQGAIHVFQFEELISSEKTDSKIRFNQLFSVELEDLFKTKENSREVSENVKLGSLRAPHIEGLPFVASLKIALHAFKMSFAPSKQLTQQIVWDEESDEYLAAILRAYRDNNNCSNN